MTIEKGIKMLNKQYQKEGSFMMTKSKIAKAVDKWLLAEAGTLLLIVICWYLAVLVLFSR